MTLEDRRHELVFDCGRSRRYHLYRVKLFQRFNVLRLILSMTASSAVFVLLLKQAGGEQAVLAVSGMVAALTILEMAVRMGRREDLHRDFAGRFAHLESRVVALGEHPKDIDLAGLEAEYLRIESEEPPILRALNEVCYNEEVQARYWDDESPSRLMIQIPFHRRCLAWLLDVYSYKRTLNAARR